MPFALRRVSKDPFGLHGFIFTREPPGTPPVPPVNAAPSVISGQRFVVPLPLVADQFIGHVQATEDPTSFAIPLGNANQWWAIDIAGVITATAKGATELTEAGFHGPNVTATNAYGTSPAEPVLITLFADSYVPAEGNIIDFNYEMNRFYIGTNKTTFEDSHAFIRNSKAWWLSDGGYLIEADVDVARRDTNGILIEQQSANMIRNSVFAGAVPGSPGTLPTNWYGVDAPIGLARTVVGIHSLDGFDCIDLRYTGIASGGYFDISFDAAGAAFVVGETWDGSFAAAAPGDITGLTEVRVFVYAVPGFNDNSGVPILGQLTPDLKRFDTSRTFNVAGNTALDLRAGFYVTNGAFVDFTIRLAAPQIEKLAYDTSPIVTEGAAYTRIADQCTAPVALDGDFTIAGVLQASDTDLVALCALALGPDLLNTIRIRRGNVTASQLTIESIVAGASQGAVAATGALVAGGVHGFSARRVGTALSISLDGGPVATTVIAAQPGVPTSLFVGQRGNGTGAWNKFIKRLTGYGPGVTDEEMRVLSTIGGIS